jgi:hypothetical protein
MDVVGAVHAPKLKKREESMPKPGKLFLSYRREDSSNSTGRIYEWIIQRVPKRDVFLDIDTIDYGEDFARKIMAAISQCKAVLIIIGSHWFLEDGSISPYVREELETAARAKVLIIPVLVEGATMPAPAQLPPSLAFLSTLNAATVRTGRDFEPDMAQLARTIGVQVGKRRSLALTLTLATAFGFIALSLIILGVLGQLPWSGANLIASQTATVGAESAIATQTARASSLTATTSAVNAGQTATTNASSTAVAAATATQIALRPFSYSAAVPGPNCDPIGQWDSSLQAGDSFTCQSDGALWTTPAESVIDFHGAPNFTSPSRFTASLDVSSMSSACIDFSILGPGANSDEGILEVCDTGQFNVQEGSRRGLITTATVGTVPTANSYHIAITYSGTHRLFSLNGQQVYDDASSGVSLDSISIGLKSRSAQPAKTKLYNFLIAALP